VRSLYLRIWLTVVAALALFALMSGWLVQRHLEQERARAEAALAERMEAWGELIQASLPVQGTPVEQQAEALREWSRRLRVPLALHDAQGERIAASDSYLRREEDGPSQRRAIPVRLDDGRTLWMMRPNLIRLQRGGPPHRPLEPPALAGSVPGAAAAASAVALVAPAGPPRFDDDPGDRRPGEPGGPPDDGRPPFEDRGPPPFLREAAGPVGVIGLGPPGELPRRDKGWLPFEGPALDWPASVGLLVLLAMLFLAVAAGAFPVVRSLTKRLERLKQGVEAFGAGALNRRVAIQGNDEVAALAASFNRAAARIETLVQSNQSLLANASHELRSPLARLKMAVTMLEDLPAAGRAGLHAEINANIAELDALVEEVLLSSRLEAGATMEMDDPVDLLGLAAEEASRVGAEADGQAASVRGSERLLRRALRNLLENARRYGGGEIDVSVVALPQGGAECRVCDRGAGVPPDQRERIFEPFYRMPGHAEREGGVGLGLALVRQIAQRHGGSVHCEAREGGGSCFVLRLPARGAAAMPGG
jgi:signal transduction histidine kinase